MDFGEAIKLMKREKKLRRSNWGSEKYVRRFDPVDDDGMAKEGTQLIMSTRAKSWIFKPYSPTARDMFASDWELFETSGDRLAKGTKQMVDNMREAPKKAVKKLITNATINVKINVDDDSLKTAVKKIDEHLSMGDRPTSTLYLKLGDAKHVRGVAIKFKTSYPDQIKEIQDVLQQNINDGLISIN
ncbi:Thoeris anti-defense Tad2 family protein [Levilactobacillus brevis]|uniref:Thoeris anti-defense Tad2 family protein n=1 Tax=Levilactobacillus brevis TaxID=1580 RepID=UPI003D773674